MNIRPFFLLFATACAPSLAPDDTDTDTEETPADPVDTVTETLADGSWWILLDATSERLPIQLDLDSRWTTLDDDWELSLVRYVPNLNEGVSVQAFPDTTFDDATPSASDDDWLTGDDALDALDTWWSYDQATHEVTAADITFAVLTGDQAVYTLRFEDYYADAGTPATVSLHVALIEAAPE